MTQQLKHSKQFKQARQIAGRDTSKQEASSIRPNQEPSSQAPASIPGLSDSEQLPKLPKGTRIRW